jgi:hypothetical protein
LATVIPGAIGALTGAYLLSSLEHYSTYTKPVVSLYTLILGGVILKKAFFLRTQKNQQIKSNEFRYWVLVVALLMLLAAAAGVLSYLSSLIAGGRNPRFSLRYGKAFAFFIALW